MKITLISPIYTVKQSKNIPANSSNLPKDVCENIGTTSFTGRKCEYINPTNFDHILDRANKILQINVKTEKDLIEAIETRKPEIEAAIERLKSRKKGKLMVEVIRRSLGICPAEKNKFYTQTDIGKKMTTSKTSDKTFRKFYKTAIIAFQDEMGMQPNFAETSGHNILKRLLPNKVNELIEVKNNIASMSRTQLLDMMKNQTKLRANEMQAKASIMFSKDNLKNYKESLKEKHPNLSEEKFNKAIRFIQKIIENKIDNSDKVALLKDEEFRETVIDIIKLIAESLDGTRGRKL